MGIESIKQNRVGTLYRKVPQMAATTFPQFQVSHLHKILYQGPGWLAPPEPAREGLEVGAFLRAQDAMLPRVERLIASDEPAWHAVKRRGALAAVFEGNAAPPSPSLRRARSCLPRRSPQGDRFMMRS